MVAWLLRAAWAAGLACVAIGVLVLVNLAGGELAAALGLPRGGAGRLAWDLGFLALASAAATALVVAGARAAPATHGLAFGAMLTALAGWAAWQAGADFPAWFVAGAVLVQPPAAWAGAALGLRARR